ncbi:unnamed protein product, partial [Amoebophrya sp. A25]
RYGHGHQHNEPAIPVGHHVQQIHSAQQPNRYSLPPRPPSPVALAPNAQQVVNAVATRSTQQFFNNVSTLVFSRASSSAGADESFSSSISENKNINFNNLEHTPNKSKPALSKQQVFQRNMEYWRYESSPVYVLMPDMLHAWAPKVWMLGAGVPGFWRDDVLIWDALDSSGSGAFSYLESTTSAWMRGRGAPVPVCVAG